MRISNLSTGGRPIKKEKGWRVTTFTVSIKHRPEQARSHIAADIKWALMDRDEIKTVRVKVTKGSK